MENTNLSKILHAAEFIDTSFAQLPDLNKLLKQSSGLFGGFFGVDGGLGDEYELIKPHLTINGKDEITAITNEQNIFNIAEQLNTTADTEKSKKHAYKAALGFALIAIFGSTVSLKIKSFEALRNTFGSEGMLADKTFHQLCTMRITPIPAKTANVLANKIIWSWKLTGLDSVLAYEQARHEFILGGAKVPSIAHAFSLLGLSDNDTLKEENVTKACLRIKNNLSTVAELNAEAAASNPLFADFDAAQKVLLDYVRFKNFNCEEELKNINGLIATKAFEKITDQSEHYAIAARLNKLDAEFQAVQALINTNDPFLTEPMINQRLGARQIAAQAFPVQTAAEISITTFINLVMAQIQKLLSNAETAYTKLSKTTPLSEDDLKNIAQHCEDLQLIINFISKVKAWEFNVQTTIITYLRTNQVEENVVSTRAKLDQLRIKQEMALSKIATEIMTLYLFLQSETDNLSAETNLLMPPSIKQKNGVKIVEDIAWLEKLDNPSRAIVNAVIAKVAPSLNIDTLIEALKQNQIKNTQAIATQTVKYQQKLEKAIGDLDAKYQAAFALVETAEKESNGIVYDWKTNLTAIESKIPNKSEFAAIEALMPKEDQTFFLDKTNIAEKFEALQTLKNNTESRFNTLHLNSTAITDDVVVFNRLVNRITDDKNVYQKTFFGHDKARLASLTRLNDAVTSLSNDKQATVKEKTATLLKKIHQEELETAKSHEKIGYFGKYRFSRLQKMYIKIINDYKSNDVYAYTADEDTDKRHKDRCGATAGK